MISWEFTAWGVSAGVCAAASWSAEFYRKYAPALDEHR